MTKCACLKACCAVHSWLMTPPQLGKILPERISFVLGGPCNHQIRIGNLRKSALPIASRWSAEGRYQSIDDTIVQLLASQTSVLITASTGFNRNADNRNQGARQDFRVAMDTRDKEAFRTEHIV
jgi:hypothetical protein